MSGDLTEVQFTELRTVVTNLETALRLQDFHIVDRATQRLAEFMMTSTRPA